MTHYRAYTIGPAGRIIGYEPLICANDKDAIEKAVGFVDEHDIELWSGKRFVVRLSSSRAAPVMRGSPDKGKAGETVTLEVKNGRLVPKSPKLDLEAEALEALAMARALPCGRERAEALKRAGTLQNIAISQGLSFAKRGRPAKI